MSLAKLAFWYKEAGDLVNFPGNQKPLMQQANPAQVTNFETAQQAHAQKQQVQAALSGKKVQPTTAQPEGLKSFLTEEDMIRADQALKTKEKMQQHIYGRLRKALPYSLAIDGIGLGLAGMGAYGLYNHFKNKNEQ